MNSPRARWLAARTRNAARHGLLIAGIGAIVMVAALLTFVLLPRQADRQLTSAIAALPPARDTIMLRTHRRQADALRALADAQRTAARPAMADTDSALGDLTNHIVRARQSPLIESFRSLASAPALQRDTTVRATVNRLRDSLEALHRERDAYAARSGPDARYADMTARLTAQGGVLVALAERSLRVQAGSLPLAPAPPADSLLDEAVRTAADSVARLDALIAEAQRVNAERDRAKAALRDRMQVNIPPVAMLLASLVLGAAIGFAGSVWKEIRTPTVGDARELEALTRSRVIVHDSAHGKRRGGQPGGRARRGEAQAAVLTPTAHAWPLLHLRLSNIGDMAPLVQVLADRPVLAGAVGLNLASVAAREWRATVLVDAAVRAGAVVPLLPVSALLTPDDLGRRRHSNAPWNDQWDATRRMPLGRDASVDLVLPRRARYDAHRHPGDDTAASDPLDSLLCHYDFVVFVTDVPTAPVVPARADLVLCARLGVTPLAWVSRAVRYADESGRRIRAVVLWADDVPLAGTRAAG